MNNKSNWSNELFSDVNSINIDTAEKTSINVDAYYNALMGNHTTSDPLTQFKVKKVRELTQIERDEIYKTDGIEAKVVDVVADDMTKNELIIKPKDKTKKDDENIKLIKDFLNGVNSILNPITKEATNFYELFSDAEKLCRVHDCSFIIFDFGDEIFNWREPIDEKKIKEIKNVYVADRWQVNFMGYTSYNNNELLEVNLQGYMNMPTFQIHISRVLIFDGENKGERNRLKNLGFGQGILIGDLLEACQIYTSTYEQFLAIIKDLKLDVYKFKDLYKLISQRRESEIYDKMQLLKMAQNNYKMTVVDSEDEVTRQSMSNLTALMDAVISAKDRVSTLANIPKTRLFGDSPQSSIGGQSGLSQLQDYYDMIKSKQIRRLSAKWYRVLRLICIVLKINPDLYTFEYESLFELDEKEKAEIKYKEAQTEKLKAETYAIYIENEILSSDEIFNKEFSDQDFVNRKNREVLAKLKTKMVSKQQSTTQKINNVNPSEIKNQKLQ